MNRIEVVEYPEPLEGLGAGFVATSTGDPEFFYLNAVLDARGVDIGFSFTNPVVMTLVVYNGLVWVFVIGELFCPCVPVEDVPTTV